MINFFINFYFSELPFDSVLYLSSFACLFTTSLLPRWTNNEK